MTHLFHGDCLKILKTLESASVDSLVTDPPAGISFMGKAWDDDKGGRKQWVAWMTEVMTECLRVLKPGAHGLVWAIPRTSHWTMSALEDAGFEIRDVVTHLFGTGFPKSLDISKAIDKEAGASRHAIGINPSSRPNSKKAGMRGFDNRDGAPEESAGVQMMTAPSTDAAKQWQGYGTALKPAAEFWVLVRKPCSEKTVAKNVLKHGTGGLNIDGARIAHASEADRSSATPQGKVIRNNFKPGESVEGTETNRPDTSLGRFPANLVLSHNDDCDEACSDDCAVAMLDGQSGISKSTAHTRGNGIGKGYQGSDREYVGVRGTVDSGGASRFFYCAKASKADRGLDNKHPTVKSTHLMEYLIKLVTPAGGTVLDPFMGSGSTGVSALSAGFKFQGIEQELDFFSIASKRVV